MQCASCHFENMPGVTACGQCGANMQLGAAAIDINPPRAGAWKKHLRRWLPFRGISYRLGNYFASLSFELIPRLRPDQPSLPIYLRMIVPGWAQMAVGRTMLGRALLRFYLGMILLSFLFFGSLLGGFFFGLAIAIHASSIVDVVWWGIRNLRKRIFTAIFCTIAVGAFCYYPIITGISQILVSQNMIVNSGPFQSGDVFIYSPASYWWREPAVGDVVVYRTEEVQFQARRINTFPGLYHLGGVDYLDRIIARGGQTVQWANQQLHVDGQPSQWQPLNPNSIKNNLNISVPEGYYCIMPSVLAETIDAVGGIPTEILKRISLVRRDRIIGRVIVRNYPFTRWWWVR